MLEIHEGLRPYLGNILEVQYHLYEGLKEKFPQLNEKTSIKTVPDRELLLPYSDTREWPLGYFIPKRGLKARLWRVLGELFNRSKWLDRGRSPLMVMPATRSIRMERYGVTVRGSMGESVSQSIACGYDALTDTLYVYR